MLIHGTATLDLLSVCKTPDWLRVCKKLPELSQPRRRVGEAKAPSISHLFLRQRSREKPLQTLSQLTSSRLMFLMRRPRQARSRCRLLNPRNRTSGSSGPRASTSPTSASVLRWGFIKSPVRAPPLCRCQRKQNTPIPSTTWRRPDTAPCPTARSAGATPGRRSTSLSS